MAVRYGVPIRPNVPDPLDPCMKKECETLAQELRRIFDESSAIRADAQYAQIAKILRAAAADQTKTSCEHTIRDFTLLPKTKELLAQNGIKFQESTYEAGDQRDAYNAPCVKFTW